MANPIFSTDKGWADFPAISYGRIDQTEPVEVAGASEVVFAFDVVDANWSAFGLGEYFDLNDPQAIRVRQQSFWVGMFRSPPNQRPADVYEQAPIYRIEVTTRPGDRFYDLLLKLSEEDWVRIDLGFQGSFEVDVYGGLFVAPFPKPVHLKNITIIPGFSAALSAAFDMDTWPDATSAEIESLASGLPDAEFLASYDVGQGSSNALLDANETAVLYFDLGCGVYGNAKTSPFPLRFCWRAVPSPSVVLSHWDADHWAGEARDPAASRRTWLAPRQKIGATHTTFASKILKAGGTIRIWGSLPTNLSVWMSARRMDFARCNGAPSSRNDSGICCLIDGGTEAWLLPGDAGYHVLNLKVPHYVSCIVAPHHGATMSALSLPPMRRSGYARIIYSFGAGNKHGRTKVVHPTSAGVQVHSSNGWSHGAWPPNSPGHARPGGDALATAAHPASHLDGVVVGWSTVPAVPFGSVPCGPNLCTGKLAQS